MPGPCEGKTPSPSGIWDDVRLPAPPTIDTDRMTRIRSFRLLTIMILFGSSGPDAWGRDPIPSIDQSVEAWYEVREWVTDFSVPRESPTVPIDHASGCNMRAPG